MQYIRLAIIIILFCSCSLNKQQEIYVPKLHAGFYSEALSEINDQLRSDPTNINLVEQKLYYCDQLGWPTNCVTALDQYKDAYGMTNQLVEQYIAYYIKHERYQLLLDVIRRWNQEYDLEKRFQRPLIQSLVKTKDIGRAKLELRNFLKDNDTEEDLSFAAKSYLDLGDTLMTIYQLSKLERIAPNAALMLPYGKLLIEMGYDIKGFNVIENYFDSTDVGKELSLDIALTYAKQSWYPESIKKMKPFADSDTVAYLISDWFKQDLIWDSAIMYVDSVIFRDSLNAKARWKKARLYEDRGWLSSSLEYYNDALELSPRDSTIMKRIDLIQRKIAYLQRQKFEESKVPLLELEPLKMNN